MMRIKRFLLYIAHLYEKIIERKNKFARKLQKVAKPEFYVFYNGERKTEQEYTMKLSDAFHKPQDEPMCELKVRFMSIIGDEGKNLPVVQKCDMLRQYCEFMDIVFRYQAELKETPTKDEQKTCYERAIREAISKNILVDYLTRKGTAVINMFTDEYDYNLDMQAKMEDAALRKAVENAKTMLSDELPPEKVALYSGLPLEQVLELQKQIAVKA